MAVRLRLSLWFYGVLLVLTISLMVSNLRHGLLVDDRSVLEISLQASKASSHNNVTVTPSSDPQSTLGSLSCQRYGGPDDAIAAEMVYWHVIDGDLLYVSRFRTNPPKHLLYRPDGGGFNNYRMSQETMVVLAAAMGRTLVWPPAKHMSRRHFGDDHLLSKHDFFHDSEAIDAVSSQEFLQSQAVTGKLRNRTSGEVCFPPGNRTNFDGDELGLRQWYQQVMPVLAWNPNQCVAVFPDSQSILEMFQAEARAVEQDIQAHPPHESDFTGRPVPVDAPWAERLRENWAGRQSICLYDSSLQEEPNLLISGRMLANFYEFVMFEDWNVDLWMRRFVRDHLRYTDELQCAAARVVEAVRARSHARNHSGAFDSMHVRRGDFLEAYPPSNVTGEQIYDETKKIFPEGSTVYMATNEKDRSFFQPLMAHYDVVFLEDLQHLLGELKDHHLGLVDQLVASRGRHFMGCWWSTFTSYINRLRGYHSQNDKAPRYEAGVIDSWYYYRPAEGYFVDMQQFAPPNIEFFSREYPTAWRQIDHGIENFHAHLQAVDNTLKR